MKAKIQYTIREIPANVDTALRKIAKAQGKSINTLTLEALKAVLGIGSPKVLQHDLDFMAKTWIAALVIQFDAFLYSHDPDFEKIPQLPRYRS